MRILFAVALVTFATPVFAQEFRSTITGRVVDAQGSVIPDVEITAVQVETGARHQTKSSQDGEYVLPFLPPSNYQITAQAQGFKRFVREGVRVGTGERLGIDITLEVGQINDSVTVTAEAPILTTTTASTGQIIGTRQIENMPMNGRTALVLAQLAFGVIPSSDPRFYRPFDNAGPSGFSIGGAPAQRNELLIDGIPNTTKNLRVAYNPPVDSVEEVKVDTFQADAAYGHSGGGTVNVVLKGGTNSVHGTAYWFNQITNLAAGQFFTNRAGQPKPTLRYNQWGANGGGPVYIPKVFDGRNRLFFYMTYEGVRDALPRPDFATVPTAAQRNGDFSAILGAGANYQIWDPATGVQEGARIRRQPFANNIIPAARISPVARNYIPLLPQPNTSGGRDGGDNYLTSKTGERNFFNNEMGRLDVILSQRHKMFGNFRYNERSSYGFNILGYRVDQLGGDNGGRSRTNLGTTFDDVFTISPTMVLNTRAGWTRFTEGNANFTSGYDIGSLGFPSSLNSQAQRRILPRVQFDRFTGIGATGGTDNPQDVFQIFSNLTKIRGRHSIKTGVDLRLYRETIANLNYTSGLYNFSTNWTRGELDNAAGSPLGQDFAAFLLGLPTSGNWDISATRTNQAGYYAIFVQDDVNVRQGLTINIGVRYERDQPTTERYNRSVSGFDYSTASPIDAAVRAAYARTPIAEIPASQFKVPGGLLFPSSGNRYIYNTQGHYFSPRFGIAWTPAALGNKTVIRAGTGVFFAGIGSTGINQHGFSQATDLVPTLDGFLTPTATLSNPFPNGIQQPPGSRNGLATDMGKAVTFYNPRPLNPYSVRWNFGVQRQLGRNMVLEAGYFANHSVHLALDAQINYVPRQYLSTLPTRDQAVINNLTANVASPFAGLIPGTALNGTQVARQQLLRPFPQFTSVTLQEQSDGSSYFHMFAVRLDKRFSNGLQFLSNYSLAKLMERRGRLNDFDGHEKRIAGEDRPMRFVTSVSYDIPFGVKKRYGGWVVNGIYTFQLGAPLNFGNVIYYGGPLNVDSRNVDQTFDRTRFNTVSNQQLANNVRTFPSRFGNLRQDGANNLDFSILKNTTVFEHVNAQFRCEFFNAMNHATFNPPNLNPAVSNFGTITTQANISRRIQLGLRLVW